MNPIDGFSVSTADVGFVGRDLQRPECILAEPDGSVWVADARGGVVHISPDGSQRLIAQQVADGFGSDQSEAEKLTTGTLPNGLAFAKNGDIYISNFGTDCLELMDRDGRSRVIADSIEGAEIGKVNFVLRDTKNRLWLTISTRRKNWMTAMRPDIADGFVALYDQDQLRIVADGFSFTNELRLDANEEWLYVAETCGAKITRLRVAEDGSLSQRETFGPENHGALIDGIAFDGYGNLWGTHIFADRVFVLTPDGDMRIILDDGDKRQSDALMGSFWKGELTPEQMLAAGGKLAPWIASVTFGGPDLRTVFVGSLKGKRIPYFRSPVAGLPPVHWEEAKARLGL